jgi:MoxR-like ATPase
MKQHPQTTRSTNNNLPMNENKYFPDPGLRAAVEVARDLHMPLLVTGEPGTGKTELSKWIAGEEMLNSGVVHRFDTKTTSQAKDLFYRYDAIRHFGDREANPLKYITFEAMGKAILRAQEDAPRQIVLVDEIDKAPRDFPNDVLFQFEQFAFRVEEATRKDFGDFDFSALAGNKSINLDANDNIRLSRQAKNDAAYIAPPFLLLTSNSEKNLPDAFLRRCVFYHIPFPDKEELKKILRSKAQVSAAYLKHLDAVVDFFRHLRELGPTKKPATAELISWMKSLEIRGVDWAEMFQEIKKDKPDPLKFQALRDTMPVLLKNKEDLEKLGNTMPV